MSEYIGLKGQGQWEVSLPIIKETPKAYLLRTWEEKDVWMPKSCFNEDGSITEKGYDLLLTKMEDSE